MSKEKEPMKETWKGVVCVSHLVITKEGKHVDIYLQAPSLSAVGFIFNDCMGCKRGCLYCVARRIYFERMKVEDIGRAQANTPFSSLMYEGLSGIFDDVEKRAGDGCLFVWSGQWDGKGVILKTAWSDKLEVSPTIKQIREFITVHRAMKHLGPTTKPESDMGNLHYNNG